MGPAGAGPEPYRGTPAVPPSGRPNRTGLVVGLCAIAAVVVVIVALAGGDDDGGDETGPASTGGPTASATPDGGASAGPGGAGDGAPGRAEGIDVVEQGFTNFPANLEAENHVTYAYILENTTDRPLTELDVTVTLLDANGATVVEDLSSVTVIQPGARLGLGKELYQDSVEVTDMQVKVETSPLTETTAPEGGIAVEGVTATTGDNQHSTTFTARSSYDIQFASDFSAYAIYRDSGSRILGGSSGGFVDATPAGGTSSGQVTSLEAIPGVDPAQTEVYVDPDNFDAVDP